MTRIFEREYR